MFHIRKASGRTGLALTNAGLLGGGALVALMTLAVVRPRRVDTVSVNTGVTDTLIYVWGGGGREG